MKLKHTKEKCLQLFVYLFILLAAFNSNAQKNYYLSSSKGNDMNKGSEKEPWQSLEKNFKNKIKIRRQSIV